MPSTKQWTLDKYAQSRPTTETHPWVLASFYGLEWGIHWTRWNECLARWPNDLKFVRLAADGEIKPFPRIYPLSNPAAQEKQAMSYRVMFRYPYTPTMQLSEKSFDRRDRAQEEARRLIDTGAVTAVVLLETYEVKPVIAPPKYQERDL